MRVIPVNWTELETAFERNGSEIESFLDSRTGDVVSVIEGALDHAEQRAKVQASPESFVRIEPAASREQYRWMERFVGMVTDTTLRERLMIAIDGKGAFRRFKDVLVAYPAERERWFSFRGDLLHWHMARWLEREALAAQEEAPWGTPPTPPADTEPTLERPAGTPEGPGEILRRQAKELLDQIPAVELPAAIAFLDYLRERGSRDVNRARPPLPPKRTAA
jgi:hypothetical protein